MLVALEYAHQNGVIHGDIKALNLIVNPDTRMLKIIDWGLGNFYEPGKTYSIHVGTRYIYCN
jgi:casein kinase II subunit alpha